MRRLQKKTTIEDIKPKKLISAHGEIKIKRRYRLCSPCETYFYPADVILCLPKRYTNGLKRMVSRCVGQTSYEIAKGNLAELCQIYLSSALGDGAKWIWNIVREVFGKTDECLDIYHGAEHISDCGKVLIEGATERKEWFERMRMVLLSEGFPGVERELRLLKTLDETQRTMVDSLLEYLKNNAHRLSYAERLAAGRAIGSGLIEGACKNLIGKPCKLYSNS